MAHVSECPQSDSNAICGSYRLLVLVRACPGVATPRKGPDTRLTYQGAECRAGRNAQDQHPGARVVMGLEGGSDQDNANTERSGRLKRSRNFALLAISALERDVVALRGRGDGVLVGNAPTHDCQDRTTLAEPSLQVLRGCLRSECLRKLHCVVKRPNLR